MWFHSLLSFPFLFCVIVTYPMLEYSNIVNYVFKYVRAKETRSSGRGGRAKTYS